MDYLTLRVHTTSISALVSIAPHIHISYYNYGYPKTYLLCFRFSYNEAEYIKQHKKATKYLDTPILVLFVVHNFFLLQVLGDM